MIQFRLRLLLFDPHPSILGCTDEEEGPHLQTALQKGKHIRIAVGHMNPHSCLWWAAHLLHRSCPDLAFPWSLVSLSAALFAALLVGCSGLAHPDLLMQDPKHPLALALGRERQHRMDEEAAMSAIADGPQAADGRPIAAIHFGVIMHQQEHSTLLLHLLAGLLPNGRADGLMADSIGSHEPVSCLECSPISPHLARQTALWISGHPGRYLHQALGASWIS